MPESLDFRATRDLMTRRLRRNRLRRSSRVALLALGDLVLVAVAIALLHSGLGLWDLAARALTLGLLTVLSQAVFMTYGPGRHRRRYMRAGYGAVIAVVGYALITGALAGHAWTIPGVATLTLALGLGHILARYLAELATRSFFRLGVAVRRTLVVGSEERGREMEAHFAEAGEQSTKMVGFVGSGSGSLGPVERLGSLVEEYDVSHVVLAASLAPEEFRRVVRECLLLGAGVAVVPHMLSGLSFEISSRDVAGWPLIEIQVPRLHAVQVWSKRAFDVGLSLAALIVTLPLMAAIALALKLEGPRWPVLFRQVRPGLGGRAFTMLKFRSMRPDAEALLEADPILHEKYLANGCKLPEGEDPRISRVGAFIRRTSLDELPQLINVLRGDMSLVGPRPLVGPELRNYGNYAPVLLGVRPGITGYWQVNGRSAVGYPDRAKMDVEYIANWSLVMDVKILLKTIPQVFGGRGAH